MSLQGWVQIDIWRSNTNTTQPNQIQICFFQILVEIQIHFSIQIQIYKILKYLYTNSNTDLTPTLHYNISGTWLGTYLRDGQYHVGGRGQLAQLAHELVAHHFRQHHADGLTQHDGLGLNASHTCNDRVTV